MLYDAYFKRVGEDKWHVLKNVKGDGIIAESQSRFFILEDETRIEIPATNMLFKFPPRRFLAIKKQMELEAGQSIPTNDGAS